MGALNLSEILPGICVKFINSCSQSGCWNLLGFFSPNKRFLWGSAARRDFYFHGFEQPGLWKLSLSRDEGRFNPKHSRIFWKFLREQGLGFDVGFAGILALEGRAGRNVVEPGYLVVSEAGERGKHGKILIFVSPLVGWVWCDTKFRGSVSGAQPVEHWEIWE